MLENEASRSTRHGLKGAAFGVAARTYGATRDEALSAERYPSQGPLTQNSLRGRSQFGAKLHPQLLRRPMKPADLPAAPRGDDDGADKQESPDMRAPSLGGTANRYVLAAIVALFRLSLCAAPEVTVKCLDGAWFVGKHLYRCTQITRSHYPVKRLERASLAYVELRRKLNKNNKVPDELKADWLVIVLIHVLSVGFLAAILRRRRPAGDVAHPYRVVQARQPESLLLARR